MRRCRSTRIIWGQARSSRRSNSQTKMDNFNSHCLFSITFYWDAEIRYAHLKSTTSVKFIEAFIVTPTYLSHVNRTPRDSISLRVYKDK